MASTDRDSPATTLEIAQPEQSNVLSAMLKRVAASSGRPISAMLGDFIKTSIGPGKLNFDEFVGLGLYDPARNPGADIRGFAGLAAMQRIWAQANFRTEFEGLVGNKIAMAALLEAYGFPVIPIAALAATAVGHKSARILHSKEAIRAFLSDGAHYPLFGKPVTGWQSLGALSIDGYDPAQNTLILHDGKRSPLDSIVDDITTHYADGYLFQPRLPPHASTRAICGDRLATVRVLTAYTDNGPKILRACEKLPAGENAADNFWHSGNLLVQLNLETGMRQRAISGKGFDMREHSHHPDSNAAITGTFVPNWSQLCEVVLEATRFVKDTALIGWDIAPVDSGVVIVEANATPDLMLPQLADCRGIIDAEFREFLVGCKTHAAAWKRECRTAIRQLHRTSFMR
jgi:hypothetical protein